MVAEELTLVSGRFLPGGLALSRGCVRAGCNELPSGVADGECMHSRVPVQRSSGPGSVPGEWHLPSPTVLAWLDRPAFCLQRTRLHHPLMCPSLECRRCEPVRAASGQPYCSSG